MRLYIVQHGDSVAKEIDPNRPLSDQGQADIQRLAEWLSSHNVRIGQILHSGKTRAKETAEILRPLLKFPAQIYEGQGLSPNDSPEAFLYQLGDSKKDTLIAGHMPFVARTVSQALTGAPDRQLVEFVPGSVAGLERSDGASWRLFFFARPEFFNRGELSQAVS
ncbi:MAG: phosphohistidine phosphatase SixA [candidate division Zixibacteria bacterium]